jgi:serine protease Do
MRVSRWLAVGAVLVLAPGVPAQSELGRSLKDIEVAPHWVYDDLPRALGQARRSGQPLLAVLRCVPCAAGHALDEQVTRPGPELERLEKQFVCVRVIQARGLDLRLFQFDYDQSWCAFFLNADGVIYGRYGTRTGSGPDSDTYLSVASFRKAADRALDLHRGYPANKDRLAGKIGKGPENPVPEKIPGLERRAKGPTTRQTCIHCHMIREYTLRAKWERGRLTPADLWAYPMPDNLGLTLDREDGLRVKAVAAGSPAAAAGLAAGDDLVALDGQPLVSLADVQWVLHTAPAEGRLAVTLRRGGRTLEKTVALGGRWKESDLAWRASAWYGLRQGLQTEPLSAAEKRRRGLAPEGLALAVKGLYGRGKSELEKAGLRKGDVIVGVDGRSEAMSESQFLADLRLRHGPKDSVRFTVLRGGRREELTVPMW